MQNYFPSFNPQTYCSNGNCPRACISGACGNYVTYDYPVLPRVIVTPIVVQPEAQNSAPRMFFQ